MGTLMMGLNGDRHIRAEKQQETQKALNRKSCDTTTNQGRYLRLIDTQDFGSLNLGQTAAAENVRDANGKIGFSQQFVRVRQSEIGEYVAAALAVILFSHVVYPTPRAFRWHA